MSKLKFKTKEEIMEFVKETSPYFFSSESTFNETFIGIYKNRFFITKQTQEFGEIPEVFIVREVTEKGKIISHDNPYYRLPMQPSWTFRTLEDAERYLNDKSIKKRNPRTKRTYKY